MNYLKKLCDYFCKERSIFSCNLLIQAHRKASNSGTELLGLKILKTVCELSITMSPVKRKLDYSRKKTESLIS